MGNVLGILFILLVICALVTLCLKNDSDFIYSCLGGSIAFAISFSVVLIAYFHTPTAMDVYRDKTTLEITYRDSVAVDSVVVWKEK